jgi:hypothetical protein
VSVSPGGGDGGGDGPGSGGGAGTDAPAGSDRGREREIFRKVLLWSLVFLAGMCVLVLLQSTPVLGWMVVAG